MVIFVDEEFAYRSWLAHHRAGFVLDAARRVAPKQLVLHRAACPEVRPPAGKRTHATTGARMKLCALASEELVRWSSEHLGGAPRECATCRPTGPAPRPDSSPGESTKSWTRQERQIMDYVLDVAVIHLDNGESGYHLTVGDLAAYLSKSVRQIAPAVLQLVERDDLRLVGKWMPGAALAQGHGLLPTVKSLRTVPAYADLPAAQLASLLAHLAAAT